MENKKEKDIKSKDVCNLIETLYNDRSYDEEYRSLQTDTWVSSEERSMKKGH